MQAEENNIPLLCFNTKIKRLTNIKIHALALYITFTIACSKTRLNFSFFFELVYLSRCYDSCGVECNIMAYDVVLWDHQQCQEPDNHKHQSII